MAAEMKLDADEVFSDLYQDESIFRAHLLALQDCINDRKSYHHWAHRLRFIAPVKENQAANTVVTPSNKPEGGAKIIEDDATSSESSAEDCQCSAWPSFRGHVGDQTLQITPAACCPDCTHYVAVSWCWKTTGSAFEHHMVGEVNRQSKTPAVVMSRAIKFAANKSQRFIWIDKECIDQEDRNDKEAGIQSMDLVYQRSAWPVGLLNSEFNEQSHLDIWDCLIQRQDIASERVRDLLEVLKILGEDKWFSRAWILQESVSGTVKMTLLAQHKRGLTKSEYLGTIDGEIEFTIEQLQHSLAWAEQCVDDAESDIAEELADEIKQLSSKIWDFNPLHVPDTGPVETASEIDEVYNDPDYRQTCNAAQALTYLRLRQNSRKPDRIAILANLCNYSVRLDTNKIVELNRNGLGCGFSICAFALALFNGDLSLTITKGPEHNVVSEHMGHCWGPRNDSRLQHVPYYEEDDIIVRMKAPRLLRDSGLCVSGWLWEMRGDDQVEVQTTHALHGPAAQQHPVPLILWSLLRDVAGQGLEDLTDVLWNCCNMQFFGTREDLFKDRTPTRISRHLNEALDDEMTDVLDRDEAWEWQDGDYSSSLATYSHQATEWIWRPAHVNGFMPAARLSDMHFSDREDLRPGDFEHSDDSNMFTSKPSGVFDPQDLHWTVPTSMDDLSASYYVFTPATILDTEMTRSQRRGDTFSWIIEPPRSLGGFGVEAGTGHLMIRGLQTCRGYWKIPQGAEPQTFVLY